MSEDPEGPGAFSLRIARPGRLNRSIQLAFGFAVIGIVGFVLRLNVYDLFDKSSVGFQWAVWGSTLGAALGGIGILYALLQAFLDAGTAVRLTSLELPGASAGPEPPASGGPSALERAGAISLTEDLIRRLADEVRAQGQRANANLGIGVVAAAIGLTFLAWLAFTTAPGSTGVGAARAASEVTAKAGAEPRLVMMFYWGSFLAKVTLSVATNVIAFFFLSTYRRNLSEVRYFQNELTNVQLQVASLLNAATHGFDATQEQILLSLARTERNFVLRKGETTADIAQKTLDKEEAVAFAEIIADAVKKQFAPEKKEGE